MSSSKRTIEYVLKATDSGFSSGLKAASKEAESLSLKQKAQAGQLDGVAKGLGIFGAAAIAGFGAATKASMDFDKEMSNVHAAIYGSADDTAESLGKLRTAALTSGAAFGYSARDSAAAANELIRAGRSASDVVGGELKASLAMAAADNMDLAQATSIMSAQMTVFASSGATAASVADTLAAGAGVAQGGISELGEALKYVGSSAASSGMGLQETTGLLATLANNGIMGSMAGTGLAGVLRNLKTPTTAAKKALEEIGLETYNTSGEFKGMTPLIEELGSKLDGMSSKDRDAVLSKIFDTRSLAAAIPLLNDAAVATENGSNKLRDMQDAVGQTGYAAEQAARQTDNLAGDWKTFTSSMEQAFISSTQASDNMVRSLVQGATSIVKGYDALPGAAKNAVTLITAGLGAAALGGAGLIKLTEFSGKLITSLETLGVSAQRAGSLVRGAGIMMGTVGAGLAVGLAIYASYADSVQRADDRTQALAATFDVVDGKAQATAKTIQQLMDTMSTKQADFEIFGDKGLAGAFSQLNEQASKLDLKGFGLDVAGAAKAISGSKKDYDAYIASIDALADSQVKTQRANAQTKDSWDALHPSVATYQQQQDSLAATLGTAGQQTEQVKRRLESMREEYEAGALVAEQMKASTNSLGSEYTSLAQAQADASQTIDPLALGTSDVAEQMDSAAQAVDAYVQSLYGLRDAQSGLMSDQSAFEAAIDSVAKAFDSVGTSQLAGADIMDLNTEATRNANDQLRTIADSARNYGAALMESGGSQESARAQMELAAASIMAQGEAWGLSQEQLLAFTEQLTGIPAETIATLTVDGARESIADIQTLEDALAGIDLQITSEIIAAVQSGDLDALRASMESLPPLTQLDLLTTLDAQGFDGANAEMDALTGRLAEQLHVDVSGMDAESAIAAVRGALDGLGDKGISLTAEDGVTGPATAAKSARDLLSDATIKLTGHDLISGPAATAKASRDDLTDKTISLSASDGVTGTAWGAKAAVDAIPSYKSVTIEAFHVGNFSVTASDYADGGAVVQGLASGGHPLTRWPKDLTGGGASRGPGSGTSDDIPTMLSNGEHVWTEREVEAAGGHRQMYRMRALALAGALPKYTGGGSVKVAGKSLDDWSRLIGDKEDRLQLQVRIQSLWTSLWGPYKEQETDGLKRKLAQEQYTKARAQLADMDRANWLNAQWSIASRIENEDAKIKASESSASARGRISDRASDFQTDMRRGDFADAVARGNGLSAVDKIMDWSKSGDWGTASSAGMAKAAAGFEDQLISLYDAVDAGRDKVEELQRIYDRVASSLNNTDLATDTELAQHIDDRGNVWHTKSTPTAASMTADMAARATKLKEFASKLARLVDAGASPLLAQQIAALGPEEGIGVIDAFLADPQSLGVMNTAMGDIEFYSGVAAQNVTEASQAGGLAAAVSFVKELEGQIADVGEAMAKAFAQYLGTSIPALAGARAGGGPVSAGSAYLVGERGPEVVVPATAGYVLPSGAVGSQVTNISFNGVTIRSESSQDVETLKRFVTMAGRQNQGGLR